MTEILTTFQWVVLAGLVAPFFYFWGLGIVATVQNDIHKALKYMRATSYMAILAITFFLRCIAKNNNFDLFSLSW
ncbi:hypothetical protein HYW59_04390 [Candidatus Kaiserbacteria bacterium]|nr:hypothetical protein [Candidatus Kaiserbacteria bacterium]